MELPHATARMEPAANTSKFREVRQPPAKRRNDEPEPAVEQELVVVPGKPFAYLDEIMENFENT
jgi:hypothetical protein